MNFFKNYDHQNGAYNRAHELITRTEDPALRKELEDAFDAIKRAIRQWDRAVSKTPVCTECGQEIHKS